jgi:hypothetical protein
MRISRAIAAAVIATTSVVVAGPTATAAPPKPTAGGCSVAIPSRLSITSPYREIGVWLTANCTAAGTDVAVWEALHPTMGSQDGVIFDGTSTSSYELFDFVDLGRWKWQPRGAFDAEGDPIAQNTPYTDVKVGSWAALSGTRSGQRVTLTASVARYSASYERFIPWAGATGQLQYRIKGTSTWKALAGVRANSAGKYAYSRNWGAALEYRVYFPATPYIWNIATPTVYR